MRIKKLMVKGFGALRNWEYNFQPFWTDVPLTGEEGEETVNEVIMALLFGFPPSQESKKQRFTPVAGKDEFRAAMVVEAADGQFLLGRHFAQETLEIFKLEDKRMFSLSPMVLMDLLFKELGILNPLDFQVIGFFQREKLILDQNAPLVREHIRELRLNEGFPELLIQSAHEGEDRRLKLKEELAVIDGIIAQIDRCQKEVERLRAEEAKFGDYEKFLSPEGEDLLDLTAREYTAVALEKSFYEEQLREEAETKAILETAVASLRQKIVSFDPLLYTDETEQKVTRLLKRRAELNQCLQMEEEALEEYSRKGYWSRLGDKEKETEIKQRMESLLQDLARIRHSFKLLLKDKKPEDFLKEKALLEQYRNDLARLQRPSLLKGKNGYHQEELARIRRREEELRQKREKLLALTGSEALETVQTKVKKLVELKGQRKQAEEELESILKEVGGGTPEETYRSLLEKKESREEQLKAEENRILAVKGGPSALINMYGDAGRFLSALTEGEYQHLSPRLEGNILQFTVGADQEWCPAEEAPFAGRPWADLAFRLALAKAVWSKGKGQPLLLFDDLSPWLTAQAEQAFRDLLTEEFAEGQIICRVN